MLFSPRRNATNLVSRDKVFWSKVFSEDASAKMLDLPLTNGGLRILESLDVGEGLELRHQRPGELYSGGVGISLSDKHNNIQSSYPDR